MSKRKIIILIAGGLLLGGGFFVYNKITTPSDAVVKNIASQLIHLPADKIEVVSSYKSNGGLMIVLKAGQAICEMPMIHSDSDGWIGRGINCKGQLPEPEMETPTAILPPEPNAPDELVNDPLFDPIAAEAINNNTELDEIAAKVKNESMK